MGLFVGSIFLLLACFAAAIGSTQSGYGLWDWPALLRIPHLFLPNLLVAPLGEEPGWRGFALPRLQKRLHPLAAAVVLGFLWANWHLPLFLVSFYTTPYWLYVPFLMGASVIIGIGFEVSGESTITAIYLHGLLNVGIGVMLNEFLGKATIRDRLSTNVAEAAGFLGVAILLAISTRGRVGVTPSGVPIKERSDTRLGTVGLR